MIGKQARKILQCSTSFELPTSCIEQIGGRGSKPCSKPSSGGGSSGASEGAVVALRQTLLAATVLTLVCGQTLVAGEYIVEISGTEGTAFGGTCLLIRGKNSTSYVTSGSVPHRFEFSGDIISCAIQPKSASAHLQMVIKDSDGRVVGESTGSLPFGVVTTAGR
jgi:hypothetical protein